MKDIVFDICASMLRNSPEASYKRLNPALHDTLTNCIAADLPFQRDTFRNIYDNLRGGWWFLNGAGSQAGEHFYNTAIDCNHASAIQSFEHFAGRPGVLWEQDSKQPERLCCGSRFNWKGYYVTVTSMRKDSLVACTYHGAPSSVKGFKVGAELRDYDNDQSWSITSNKKDGNGRLLRLVKSKPVRGESSVAKRFVIKYAEIAEFRRSEAKRVKAVCEKIKAIKPGEDSQNLSAEINAQGFRHFQLEIIRAAFEEHQKFLNEQKAKQAHQARIAEWRQGKGGAFLEVSATILRVRDDLVECSNGNSVGKAAAARLLPVILDLRNQPGKVSLPIDGHTVTSISDTAVRIGCTTVPWSEIELIKPLLEAA